MAQVYGAGGKTVPKKGRLGTGSYWPQGTPIFSSRGNTFPGMQPITSDPDEPQISFGDTSRAAISTQQGRLHSAAILPNKGFYNTATIPKTPAAVVSSPGDNVNLVPLPPSQEILLMPHERNTNTASGTAKKPLPYRTVFGASKTMPTDSAFQSNPSAMYRHQTRTKPGPAVEAVKKSASVRTFARPQKPLPVSGGVHDQRNTPPASFVSRNNLWYDPNNSFMSGASSAATAQTGTGRWSMVKKGVV